MANVVIGSIEVPGKDILSYLRNTASLTLSGSSTILTLAEIISAYIVANPTDTSTELAAIKTALSNTGIKFI